MKSKLALKRLTASDLTLFEWQFRNRNAGNQKAINLNADVFVSGLYPSLPELTPSTGKIPLDLFLYGPGHRGEINLQRKIVKGDSYKNWRLNGEIILNPSDEPDRFNPLAAGDLALMEFTGDGLPSAARFIFLCAAVPEDQALHARLDQFLGRRRMAVLDVEALRQSIAESEVSDAHPAHALLLGDLLEEAALGNEQATRRLLTRRAGRRMSREDLLRARQRADEIGLAGEELVNAHLQGAKRAGEIRGFTWESRINAIAPYDFEIEDNDGARTLVDVKTTRGLFDNPIHVSLSELRLMAGPATPYRIYRVYELGEGAGHLRISEPVASVAAPILSVLDNLPSGVAADSVTILPGNFAFGEPVNIRLDDAGWSGDDFFPDL